MTIDIIAGIIGIPALNADQNQLKTAPIDAYLKSDRWKEVKNSRSALISVTHSDRNERGSDEGMGFSDELLKNGTIVGCVIDGWREDDKVMLKVEIFDDLDLYSEEQKSEILQILRCLKYKVKLGFSLILDADWDDKTGEMTYLEAIMGGDFTLDPSFVGSKVK